MKYGVYTIAEIESASNYKNYALPKSQQEDCWYIELRDTNGVFRYWRQDSDGGILLPRTHAIEVALQNINPDWKMRLKSYNRVMYVETWSTDVEKWVSIKKVFHGVDLRPSVVS